MADNRNYRFETLQLHVGQEQPDPVTDARAVPIYQTSSFVFRNSQHAADRFALKDAGNIYGRLTNPTEDVFERRIAALEGGVAALATASGAAAVTYTIQNLALSGDHIVAAKNIYGGTYNLLAHTLVDYGVTTTFVDPTDPADFEAAIQDNTKALYIETLGNPNSEVVDIEAVAAIAHAHQMVEEGVDIIDVGGDSTRPGHIQITDEEEIARVTPIIEVLKKEFDVPVSIDTYKSHVAEAALQAGADLVNDIWGLKYDKKMASVIAKYQAACCLMHNREKAEYQDFLKDFMDDMKECVRLAKAAGIEDDKIILDPGVGFGKTYEMNLEIIDKMEILNELGYPVLLGTSRKSVIGLTLDLPVPQREEGTMVTTVYGVQKGCAFVRVHDVEKNKRAIQMTKAIMRGHEV